MRKDVGVDGDAQRISQMVWLLFLKIFDDKERNGSYRKGISSHPCQSGFRWPNWAANPEGSLVKNLINFVNNDLFPALKKLARQQAVIAAGKVVG